MDSAGARLLAKMGWIAGHGLGKENGGLSVPIKQMVRPGRSGLGASEGVRVFGERKTRFSRATQDSEQ